MTPGPASRRRSALLNDETQFGLLDERSRPVVDLLGQVEPRLERQRDSDAKALDDLGELGLAGACARAQPPLLALRVMTSSRTVTRLCLFLPADRADQGVGGVEQVRTALVDDLVERGGEWTGVAVDA